MSVIPLRDDPVENSEPQYTVARGHKLLRWSRSDPALTVSITRHRFKARA
uniref:Uncharacterized protein n=1 Tax=biofilter metagenome TaxID=1070537 RepID=A0A193SCW9_9ZZZZ